MNSSNIISFDFETQVGIGMYTPVYILTSGILIQGIVCYEKYGGNPQNRGLHNMLLSLWLVLQLILNCSSVLTLCSRICIGKFNSMHIFLCKYITGLLKLKIGPLGFFIGFTINFVRLALTTMMFLVCIELLIWQNLQIFFWSYVAELDDDQALKRFFIGNFIISCAIFTIQVVSNEVYPMFHYFISGEVKNSKKFFIGG